MLRLPLGDEVAAVGAGAGLVRGLRIGLVGEHEVRAAAAEDHLEAVSGRPVDELRGDVLAAVGLGLVGELAVVLPVALRGLGVGRGRGGVGDARGRDDAGGVAGGLGELEDRGDLVALLAGADVVLDRLGHADRAVVRLHAGDHRRGGRGAVGDLGVVGVGLRQGDVRQQVLEGEMVALAVPARLLPLADAGGGDRRDRHAVADEEDHVLRLAHVRLPGEQRLELGLGGGEVAVLGLGDQRRADRLRNGRRRHRQNGGAGRQGSGYGCHGNLPVLPAASRPGRGPCPGPSPLARRDVVGCVNEFVLAATPGPPSDRPLPCPDELTCMTERG